VAYSGVCPTRVWRTLEFMVTAVAMDSRVQKLPRVRGGSYTGLGRLVEVASPSMRFVPVTAMGEPGNQAGIRPSQIQ